MPTAVDSDRYMILSSDAHAGASISGYREFLAPEWREEFDAWAAGVVNPWHDPNDATNWDSDLRLAAMDAEGVTGELLFPNTLPPFYDVMAHMSGVPRDDASFERRWAGLQAHNRWVVNFCQAVPDRRRAVLQLLPNDIDAAVAEMRWAADQDVVGGVMLPAIPPNHTVLPYYHPRYDPLWAVAVELGFPIHQHQGSGSPDPAPDTDVAESVRFVDLELWTRLTLSHLIVGGVFDRHPGLRVVWTEMPGLRWVLDDLDRITRTLSAIQSRHSDSPHQVNYSQTFGSETAENLRLTPMEYFARNCFLGASTFSPYDIRYIRLIGTERIMWGHDAPHPEGSDGHTTESLQLLFHGFDDPERQQMLTLTAADLYKFDVERLAAVTQEIGPLKAVVAESLSEIPDSLGSAFWNPNPVRELLDSSPEAR